MALQWKTEIANVRKKIFKPSHEFIEKALCEFKTRGGSIIKYNFGDLHNDELVDRSDGFSLEKFIQKNTELRRE